MHDTRGWAGQRIQQRQSESAPSWKWFERSLSPPPIHQLFLPATLICCRAVVPSFLAPGTGSMEDSFAMDCSWAGEGRMVSGYFKSTALYFYYYCISSSDHQALDPGGWGPLP